MTGRWTGDVRELTDAVTVLVGRDGGRYPSGNTVVVRGAGETVVIDPSVTVAECGGVGERVDAVLNSHGHEDHVAGNGQFPHARVHIHDDDLLAAHSLEGLVAVQGPAPEEADEIARHFLEEFHFSPRPDARGFGDGHVFDLGGVTVEAVHLPGHTRGHSGFRISGGVFFLSDIDLTGFGPYYGDVWSDLEQFEESLRRVRDEDARWYVTFHHKGIIEGRAAFLELLDGFEAVIPRRHAAMLEFLAEPRTIEEMVANRFVYRPQVQSLFAERVERRTAELHLARMRTRGEVEDLEDGRIRAT